MNQPKSIQILSHGAMMQALAKVLMPDTVPVPPYPAP